jgi:hypothetical protein
MHVEQRAVGVEHEGPSGGEVGHGGERFAIASPGVNAAAALAFAALWPHICRAS